MQLPSNNLHFVAGPLLALLLVAVLGGLLRWTYGTHRQHVAPPAEWGDGDLGLLREVSVAPSVDAAEGLRARLAAAGIRATVRPTADGTGQRLLVFAEDEADARVVLSRPN